MSLYDPLNIYFDPILTSRQRMMCRIFWNKCQRDAQMDVFRQAKHLADNFGLCHTSELYHVLKSCYVFDTRYQCQICQRLRRIENPVDLSVSPKQPYRCDKCTDLIA